MWGEGKQAGSCVKSSGPGSGGVTEESERRGMAKDPATLLLHALLFQSSHPLIFQSSSISIHFCQLTIPIQIN